MVTFRPTFVRVEGCEHGIGKLTEARSGRCQVQFFESPSGPRLHHIDVPAHSVTAVELSAETRIFCQDPRTGWWAGRIQGGVVSAEALSKGEDHYPVRFPNAREDLVPVSNLYVRWAHAIEDPTDYLAARVTDTPFFFDGRTRIVRHLASQRAAFGGITGLASAAIELLEHQVTTVRRVLADPIERYLLADEVGLGKTIEAGVLIRQHVIDLAGGARVLVVAPSHLVMQWQEELSGKFFLGAQDGVQVACETELTGIPVQACKLTMLVVDEAHRCALRAFDSAPAQRAYYERLSQLAQFTPRVLLLSATPVLHQEDGFLAMLHLLDSGAYPLQDRDGFRRRIRERQLIADATTVLTDSASSLPVQEALASIEHLRSDDPRLAKLCDDVRACIYDEETDIHRMQALRCLRSHLTETYRLHRRLLRTRRDDRRVRMLLPQRSGVQILEHADEARAECFDFLEAWRLEFETGRLRSDPADDYARLFAYWVESALSHPRLLLQDLELRLALRAGEADACAKSERERVASAPWGFASEKELIRQRRTLLAAALNQEARADRLVAWLNSNPDVTKVVLFVSDTQIAGGVAARLAEALGEAAVGVHDFDGPSLEQFKQEARTRILVCDATAEEGLNLQRVCSTIVHYDLPLEPARIEQRIGRVDRLEAKGRLRNIVFSSASDYEADWLKCLIEGVRVFDRSIAPLQYVLAESTARMRSHFLADGRAAFGEEKQRMIDAKHGLNAELRRIKNQEGIDSLEIDPEQEAAFFTDLTQADDAIEESGERAMNAWVVDRLQFDRREAGRNAFRYVHDARVPTLLPILETLLRFERSIERNAGRRHLSTEIPFRAITFSRAAAEKSSVGLMRVGHPFVAAIEALVRADDRGTAFVMWRQSPKAAHAPALYFRFDFFIEADLGPAVAAMGKTVFAKEAIKRRADSAFPVLYRTVWLDADLNEFTDPSVLDVLEQSYSADPTAGRRDVNVRRDRWDQVETVLDVVDDWDGLCRRARRQAQKYMLQNAQFADRCRAHAETVRHAADGIAESMRSRISRLTGPAREVEENIARIEAALSEALAVGIERPLLRVDSAGAIILANRALAE